MKLMTKELEQEFKRVGRQENEKDPLIIAKFFHPFSSWYWFASEYNPVDKCFFGWVKGDFPEWGYFSLQEIEELKVRGFRMERDLHWKARRFSELTAFEKGE